MAAVIGAETDGDFAGWAGDRRGETEGGPLILIEGFAFFVDGPAVVEIAVDGVGNGVALLLSGGFGGGEGDRFAVDGEGELAENEISVRGSAGALGGEGRIGECFETQVGEWFGAGGYFEGDVRAVRAGGIEEHTAVGLDGAGFTGAGEGSDGGGFP